MAIAAIEAWLKQPDYASGVQLYLQFGGNAFLKDCFLNKRLPLARLQKELKAVSEAAPEVVPDLKLEPKQKPSEDKRMVKLDPSLPKEITELEKKWREHYASADALHRDLLHTVTKAKRKAMAKEIIDHMDLVRDIWYRIQYWRENGVLFREQVVVMEQAEESLMDTINKIRNLPTYITKAKKQVPRLKDVKKLQDISATIAKKEAELRSAWDRLRYLDGKIKELGL